MSLAPDLWPYVPAVLVNLALAAFLITYDAKRRVNRALALFLVVKAAGAAVRVLAPLFGGIDGAAIAASGPVYFVVDAPVYMYAAAAFLHIHDVVPRWVASPWPYLAAAAAAGGVYLIDPATWGPTAGQPEGWLSLVDATLDLAFTAIPLAIAAYAFSRAGEGSWRGLHLFAMGTALEFTFLSTERLVNILRGVADTARGSAVLFELVEGLRGALIVSLLALLAYHAVRARSDKRQAATVFLATLVAAVATGVLRGYPPLGATGQNVGNFFHGVWSVVTPLVLAHAILKHQMLDIDVKARWGVSKGTLAGIFVAAFFVVSEGAQAIFEDFVGNELLGILAAGALVFAIAPLQRLADQVAARTVPSEEDGLRSPRGVDSVEAAYRAAVRAALRDEVLTRREEHHLAEVADNLGLSSKRALEIREEIEADHADDRAG